MKRILISLLTLLTILNAGAFDDRTPSARASAMSNAFVAVANDAWAAYYNPAGLAQVNGMQVGAAYHRPFGYSFFNTVFGAAVIPLSAQYGTAGVIVDNFGVNYKGETLSQETTVGIAHGIYLLNDIHTTLSVGYNLKYYYWKLGQSVEGRELGAAGTVGLDVGLMASIYKRTYLGVTVFNFNSPNIGVGGNSTLQRRIVVGAAYRPYSGLTTTLAMDKTINLPAMIEAGFEFNLMDVLDLRFGASTQPNRFSAGLGVHYAGFRLDYGFRNHPTLAETHSFSLMYAF
ncbi:MAG: hypothetical protein D6677_08375 [Calditrichaeota bacterium]|nr:MAG: hypothetical protein D6677_08375 [Calditrichota bacterium]